MFKLIKKVFNFNNIMNSESTEEYDMLDLLAFNCSNLTEQLISIKNTDEHDQILIEYIKKADNEYKSINDFKEDLDWFNVTEPLSIKSSLHGKIVILDFFTYCCINCIHILPALKRIEKLYSVDDGLVVIGVHSAKFDNEKDSSNILSAVQRYDITHPVVNDSRSSMWIDLNIKCWPTLLVLGPRGNPLFVLMGEGHHNTLEKYINVTLQYYKSINCIKSYALPLNPATDLIVTSNLKFPGKIVSCAKLNETDNFPELYAISDTGNHRILCINARGEVLEKIGGKTSGFCDGNFKTAKFNSPQGLTFLGSKIIYVADTENHAIRKINLDKKTVETVVGNGKQGDDRYGGNIGIEQEISSPWDVAVYSTRNMDMSFHLDDENVPEIYILLIAMAGTHQIWALFLDTLIWWKFRKYSINTASVLAGNGQEENRNNSYPNNAAFAQPSGIAISRYNKELYIADSESSCIRKLCLEDGKVMGMVGGDRNPLNLFAYGDVDGKSIQAKLQHPLGVAYNHIENCVYVADTYNHKIKKLNIIDNEIVTCTIYDKTNDLYQFNEPGGLCVNPTGDLLYVADTNNHSIEIVNLKTNITNTLKLIFDINVKPFEFNDTIKFKILKLHPEGGIIKISINFEMVPSDNSIHINTDAIQKWNIIVSNDFWTICNIKELQENQNELIKKNQMHIEIIAPCVAKSKDEEFITIGYKLNLCGTNICFQKLFAIIFPVVYDTHGLTHINESVTVKLSQNDINV